MGDAEMKESSQKLIDEFLAAIPFEYKAFFHALTEFADSLGYAPKRNKVSHFSIDFSKNKINRTIMKIETNDSYKHGIPSGVPGLRLKFYAAGKYSQIFSDGIKSVIEAFGGKYTGCYGCGRCKNALEGYTYAYPDGKKVFRCGGELIAVYGWNGDYLDEIKRLLKTQDDFWLGRESGSTSG
jgi:hypothetical protein